MEKPLRSITTLCYLEQNNRYLMLHRVKKKNDINREKWIGVGGHVEDEESPEDCLLREVAEETGLTLTRYRFRGIVTFVLRGVETSYMCLYTADRWQGTLTDSCPEGDLEWVEKKRIDRLPLWVGDKVFFRLLEEDAPFFSLKLIYEGDELTGCILDGCPLDWRAYLAKNGKAVDSRE